MLIVLFLAFYMIGCMVSSFKKHLIPTPFHHLRAAITTGHNRAFGKDNLITQRITSQESHAWHEVIAAATVFIDKHQSSLGDNFNEIRAVSDDIINTLKINYWIHIAPQVYHPADKKQGIMLNAAWIRNTQNYKREIKQARTKINWRSLNIQPVDHYLFDRFVAHLDTIETITSNLDARYGIQDLTQLPMSNHQQAVYVFHYIALALHETIMNTITLHLNTLKLLSHARSSLKLVKRRARRLRRT